MILPRLILIFLPAAILISGCSHLGNRSASIDPCDEVASFHAGYQAGTQGQPMEISFLQGCSSNARAVAQKSYRSGYGKGREKRDEAIKRASETRKTGRASVTTL